MNPSKEKLDDNAISRIFDLKSRINRELVLIMATSNYEAAQDWSALKGVEPELKALLTFFQELGIPTVRMLNWTEENVINCLIYVDDHGTPYLDRVGFVHLGHGCGYGPMEKIFDLNGKPIYWSQFHNLLGKFDRLLIGKHCRAFSKKHMGQGVVPYRDPFMTKTHNKLMSEFHIGHEGMQVRDRDTSFVDAMEEALQNLHGKGDLVDLLENVFRRKEWFQRAPSAGGWWPIRKVSPNFPVRKCIRPINLTADADTTDDRMPSMNGAPVSSSPTAQVSGTFVDLTNDTSTAPSKGLTQITSGPGSLIMHEDFGREMMFVEPQQRFAVGRKSVPMRRRVISTLPQRHDNVSVEIQASRKPITPILHTVRRPGAGLPRRPPPRPYQRNPSQQEQLQPDHSSTLAPISDISASRRLYQVKNVSLAPKSTRPTSLSQVDNPRSQICRIVPVLGRSLPISEVSVASSNVGRRSWVPVDVDYDGEDSDSDGPCYNPRRRSRSFNRDQSSDEDRLPQHPDPRKGVAKAKFECCWNPETEKYECPYEMNNRGRKCLYKGSPSWGCFRVHVRDYHGSVVRARARDRRARDRSGRKHAKAVCTICGAFVRRTGMQEHQKTKTCKRNARRF